MSLLKFVFHSIFEISEFSSVAPEFLPTVVRGKHQFLFYYTINKQMYADIIPIPTLIHTASAGPHGRMIGGGNQEVMRV